MDQAAFGPTSLTWADAVLRMGVALGLSLALGLERFLRKKPIDFRPFVVIALASCALTVGIIEFAQRAKDDTISIDPSRVLQAVMSGIGFIAAGTLFREDYTVYGAGSATSIWASGAIGIVCGLGLIWLGVLLVGMMLLVLLLSRPFTQEYTVQIDDESGSPEDGGGKGGQGGSGRSGGPGAP